LLNLSKEEETIQSGKQMLNMVLNILDVYKYEDAKMELSTADVSLLALSENAVGEVLFLAKIKNIEIINNIENTIAVKADKDICERIFTNILTNAIKYTPNNGKIILNCELQIKNEISQKQFVIVKITDTGKGIAKDKLHWVFEKFGQVEAKNSGNVRSTGLGLTFCKTATQAHGGEINVESEEGQGTTFWFTLPVGEKEIKFAEIQKKQQSNIISLSSKDKEILKPYTEKLKKLMVYEASGIEKVLKQVDNENSKTVEYWIEQIRNYTDAMNEEKYNELINTI